MPNTLGKDIADWFMRDTPTLPIGLTSDFPIQVIGEEQADLNTRSSIC